MSWNGRGRKRSWPNLRYYSCISLQGLRHTRNDLSLDNGYTNLGPPEYRIEALLLDHLRCAVLPRNYGTHMSLGIGYNRDHIIT
jgi:hypothetical protein